MDNNLEAQLERHIARKIKQLLPDWKLEEEHSMLPGSQYDMVAISPAGTRFPIEIDANSGRLDVSSVVDFGASVETDYEVARNRAAVRLNPASQELNLPPLRLPNDGYAPTLETHEPHAPDSQQLPRAIKPLLLTSRDPSPASTQYAQEFHIDIVTFSEGDSTGKPRASLQESKARLERKVIEKLRNWEATITTAESGQSLPALSSSSAELKNKVGRSYEFPGDKDWYEIY